MIFATVKKGQRPRLDDKMLKMMSPEYFQLMRACWDSDPSKRPHFSKIKMITGNLLKECKNTEYDRRSRRLSSLQQRDEEDEEEEKKSESDRNRTHVPGMKVATTTSPLSIAMQTL